MFEQALMQACQYFVEGCRRSRSASFLPDENDRRVAVPFCKCTCCGLVPDWLNAGLPDGCPKNLRRIYRLKRDQAQQIADLLDPQLS